MSDQSLGRADRLDVPAAPRQPWRLAPGHVHLIVAIAAILIVRRLWVGEGFWSTMAFTGSVCVTIGAVIAVATRRLLVSVAAVAAIVALVSVAAHVKRQAINLVLHAYDLVFYLPQGATLQFLWQSYRVYVAGAVLALALTASMLVLAYRIDPVRIGRPRAALTAVGFALLSWVSTYAVGERRHTQMEWEGLYLTSFFQSWSETLETLWRGQLMEAAAAASKEPPFRRPANCAPAVKPPHIILVHHESIVQPSLFPQLAYDRSVDPFFRSDDGRVHQLRVETYGGASTMTEFSVLTGLSTYSFGGMRQFVQWLMASKIEDTLPKTLTGCGYRNVLFYPMLKNFLFAERFFNGVGIGEIHDMKRQGATRSNERDGFYYTNALGEIGRHIASGDARPLFTFVETMATHWPYDEVYDAHEQVPGGGPGTHPEMHEYLRRLALAKKDYDGFREALERRFPGERFLLVRYGDHQPMSTRFYLGWGQDTEAEDILLSPESPGFLSFFAVNGVNYTPPAPSALGVETLDVPYLSTVLLEAAGLPLPDSYQKRRQLLTACGGKFYYCPDREAILGFQRRLIDSGLVQAR